MDCRDKGYTASESAQGQPIHKRTQINNMRNVKGLLFKHALTVTSAPDVCRGPRDSPRDAPLATALIYTGQRWENLAALYRT